MCIGYILPTIMMNICQLEGCKELGNVHFELTNLSVEDSPDRTCKYDALATYLHVRFFDFRPITGKHSQGVLCLFSVVSVLLRARYI